MEHIMLYCVLFLFITSICVPSFGKKHTLPKETEENEEDIEWRILEKEETVPRGSHVQIDLTTGERRIRVVVDESKRKQKTSVLVVNPEDKNQDETNSEDLQERLKHITGDDIVQTEAEEEPAKVKRRFKSYDELKKDFDDLHMAVKTDIEIMNGILESYKELVNSKVPSTEEIEEQQLTMLTDLEYLLHQIDNANEFVRTGGLANVVLPSLNSTSPEVRSGTARLLGSAAQSNTAVQIAALESGTIGILLRILALDKTPSVRSSTLYALSCLVRRFPIAQKKLVDEGGLTVLNNLFNTDASDKLKIQVKVLTFIHDLIVEKQDAEKTFTLVSKETNSNFSVSSIEEAKERLRQYNLIGLETRLQEQLWCNQLSSLLIEHVSLHLDVILTDIGSKTSDSGADINVEHDIIEKIIRAMISSSNLCLSDYENNSKLQEVIRVLYLWYKKLSSAEENEGDSYFADIVNILEDFSWRYKIQLQENIKDEL